VLPAGEKPKEEDEEDGEAIDRLAPGRDSGAIDLARVQLGVTPVAEWGQLVRDIWRHLRDHVWPGFLANPDVGAWEDKYTR
jgi:hypothetical protein